MWAFGVVFFAISTLYVVNDLLENYEMKNYIKELIKWIMKKK